MCKCLFVCVNVSVSVILCVCLCMSVCVCLCLLNNYDNGVMSTICDRLSDFTLHHKIDTIVIMLLETMWRNTQHIYCVQCTVVYCM